LPGFICNLESLALKIFYDFLLVIFTLACLVYPLADCHFQMK